MTTSAALGTVRAFRGIAGHVADVNVVQALGVGDGLGPLQRLNRRGRKVGQQVLRMETREVNRNVRPQI